MTKRIIHLNGNGGVSIVSPCKEAVDMYGIDQVAKMSVPLGLPFKIIEIEESGLPFDGTFNFRGEPNFDRTFREAWEVDESTLTDGVGEKGI